MKSEIGVRGSKGRRPIMEEALLKEIVLLLGTIRTGVVVIEIVACVAFGMLIAKIICRK